MSRAFTKENDSWAYCPEKQDTCMWAEEGRACRLPVCKLDNTKRALAQEEQENHSGKEE